MEKDVALGLMGAVATIGGFVLVFCGFLFTKAESYGTRTGDRYAILAKIGILPLLVSFVSCWICVMAVEHDQWAMAYGILVFKVALVITAVYAIISLLCL